ncbi:MAG: hypothetical protein QNJ98_08105 [Planctomycetota bacterium]|nr:hypothetical protein [Planctomycetota bacterium]
MGGRRSPGTVQRATQPDAKLAPYVEVRPEDESRPFSNRGRVYLATVHGDALTAFDIRDGDQLVLVRRPRAEHGDFAVLPLSAVRFPYGMQNAYGRASRADDPLTLWKVYPEANRLRLSTGPKVDGTPRATSETSAPVDAPVHGVLIGILRQPR